MADYGARAGRALDAIFPGRNRNKLIAQAFGVSVRTAKYLRAGNSWTARRLAQAADLFGDAFDAAISKPGSDSDYKYDLDMRDLDRRIARLEKDIGNLVRLVAPPLASPSGNTGDVGRRGHADCDPAPSYDAGNQKVSRPDR